MKTIEDYHNFYLKCEVLFLADVFDKFRNGCLENYGLCPSHYLNAPALSWDAMFNMTKVQLYLTSDVDVHSFFEKKMAGDISYISEKYIKANNKYLTPYNHKNQQNILHT